MTKQQLNFIMMFPLDKNCFMISVDNVLRQYIYGFVHQLDEPMGFSGGQQ